MLARIPVAAAGVVYTPPSTSGPMISKDHSHQPTHPARNPCQAARAPLSPRIRTVTASSTHTGDATRRIAAQRREGGPAAAC